MRIVGGKLAVPDQCIACQAQCSKWFSSIPDVFLRSALEAIARRCKRLAGFGKNCLRSLAARVPCRLAVSARFD